MRYFSLISLFVILTACSASPTETLTGADQMENYLPFLKGKSVALLVNHTSLIDGTHLVDTLISHGIDIRKVFAPEHGFRGKADAGAQVENEIDLATGLPIISLYGKHKKPYPEDLEDIDLLVFDIQDVGVRFYTYISTLHYVMESCAEQDIDLLVLDRPNPNSTYIDGPVLDTAYRSFVGMHPIPVVHALSMGELAQMINGEGWLKGSLKCELKIIPCTNYYHGKPYSLPVKPSPNLPNDHAIKLYPSTCFFEGTVLSEGRGTLMPFEIFGHPDLQGDFSFTPIGIEGMSLYPKLKGQLCYGEDLRSFEPENGWNQIFLSWMLDSYKQYPDKENFFIPFFDKLAGTSLLREQIECGSTEEEIRSSWEPGLEAYKSMRFQYLLYK